MNEPISILVVDDERRIADTLVLILNMKGYIASATYDGSTALALCHELVPDLVLSDVVMPGLNGVELAIELRQSFPHCQVLLFSGQAATADILEQARAQGYEFPLLAKPVHPEVLLEKVRSMVGPSESALEKRAG